MILYHGSNSYIPSTIEPRISYDYKPLVYATDDLRYAILRCSVGGCAIKEDYDGRNLTVVELEENAFEKAYNTNGYIYTVDSDLFTNNGTEWISTNSVKWIEMYPVNNVYNALKIFPIDIISYKDSRSYFEEHQIDYNAYMLRRALRNKKLKDMKELCYG